jgi:hypothetical protein
MNRALRCGEQGQGTVEALLVVAVLLALACAIAWTGKLQHRVMALAQAGRAMAFAAARGYVLPDSRDGARLRMTRESGAWADDASMPAQLSRDWLRTDARLLTVQAAREVAPSAGLESLHGTPARLARFTSVAEAGGHAVSDDDGQHRLTHGRLGWSEAADESRALSNRLRGRIAGIENAWGKRQPGDDWVSAWAGLVPADRLASRGSR